MESGQQRASRARVVITTAVPGGGGPAAEAREALANLVSRNRRVR